MSIPGEVNSAIRTRFENFGRFGYPKAYITLPHGFKAEVSPGGDIVLYHTTCPTYPLLIGFTELSPYRWKLALSWDKAAVALVRMLDLEVEQSEEVLPY